ATLRTYCRAAARTSSSVTAGSRLCSVWMLRHMPRRYARWRPGEQGRGSGRREGRRRAHPPEVADHLEEDAREGDGRVRVDVVPGAREDPQARARPGGHEAPLAEAQHVPAP